MRAPRFPIARHRSSVGLRAAAAAAAAALTLGLAGCGETPDPNASRTAPAEEGTAGTGEAGREAGEGGSRSTLGRARDRAESVIKDMEAADQRRMDLIDEMNGREPGGGDGGAGNDDSDGDG
jgi:hypothetical protein